MSITQVQAQELFVTAEVEYFVSKIIKVKNMKLNSSCIIQAQENPKKKMTAIADQSRGLIGSELPGGQPMGRSKSFWWKPAPDYDIQV